MSNISVFNFNKSSIRIQLLNNEPIFCLSDVASILNIKNSNSTRFNLSESGVHKMYIRLGGQSRELTFINEPNLYRVIFRSNKAEAIEFQNWVFETVLPSIRKTGSYHSEKYQDLPKYIYYSGSATSPYRVQLPDGTGKTKHLGQFASLKEAAAIRDKHLFKPSLQCSHSPMDENLAKIERIEIITKLAIDSYQLSVNDYKLILAIIYDYLAFTKNKNKFITV